MKKIIAILFVLIGGLSLQDKAFAGINNEMLAFYTPISSSQTTNFVSIPTSNNSVNNSPHVYKQNNFVGGEDIDIEFLIDYSKNMSFWTRPMRVIMQQALTTIPYYTYAGVRVFGHDGEKVTKIVAANLADEPLANPETLQEPDKNKCDMTEQIYPISKVKPSVMLSAMDKVALGSSSPLVTALDDAINNDFKSQTLKYKRKIILITSGTDSCEQDPCKYIKKLLKKRDDIQIDVIMLNSSKELSCLATLTQGRFYNATTVSSLEEAIKASIRKVPALYNY